MSMTRTSTPELGKRFCRASWPLRAMTTSCPFIRRASASTRCTDASSSTTPTLIITSWCRTFIPEPASVDRPVRLRSGHPGEADVMTSTIDRTLGATGRSSWRAVRTAPAVRQARRLPVVWIIALGAVCLRLPLLSHPPSPDESGFLLVGGQWHSGGNSLYGGYWVDRPPLLITLFRIAADAGGLVPLRLMGCVATVLTILGVATLARQIGGRQAGAWAALAAGVLLVSPLTGSQSVNGELLAAPFAIWGMAAA